MNKDGMGVSVIIDTSGNIEMALTVFVTHQANVKALAEAGLLQSHKWEKLTSLMYQWKFSYSKEAERKKEMQRAEIPENLSNQFQNLFFRLEPENLSCDGELSAPQQRKRYNLIMDEWKELEKQVGRQVTQEEIENLIIEKMNARFAKLFKGEQK